MLNNIVGILIIILGAGGLAVWVFIASQLLNKDPIKRDVGLIGPTLGVFATVIFRYIYTRFNNALVFYLGIGALIFLFYLIFTNEIKFKNQRLTRILNILCLLGLLAFILFIIRAGWYKIIMNY